MDSAWIGAFTGIVVSVLSYLAGRATSKANANAVDVNTFQELVDKVEGQSDKILTLQQEMGKLARTNSALWQYVYALVESIRQHKRNPPSPPLELQSDPKLMKLIQENGEK